MTHQPNTHWFRPVSWDETFASRYEEWSAQLTADVAFYVEQSAGAIVADLAGCGSEETL